MTVAVDDNEGGNATTDHLGERMSRVARRLQEEHGDVEATLQAIAAAAVGTVPNAEDCGITYVIGRKKVEPRAWTSDLPKGVDSLQERLEQGPCLDAVWEEEVVRVDDVASDERWPEFAREASDLGVGSMMCFQLFVVGDQLGALNLYARTPGAFDDDSQDIALIFASHAAVALAGAEHESNLRAGLSNRDVIGQAKGILMERHRITADQAFGVLTRVSQEMNRKLVDIARELTDTGAVPRADRRRD
ncbi:GAF and ANTAR domain-containing protein [Blastococcus saxobsidens]|uniref:Response regulator receiver and ANTAR, GAF and CheY domains n=1 Tax=Blastococcus saxobsidens (strain DD2) TaxID=1146883 RepID=H6RN88_BLASD|nr:GAF and ANTAR domain-containing protein [Blastococcus saxobsidens]CCG02636.1 Response regulator receiver and ANTAR, GAF and CheY domains [Blastococcus saxobsidens DD2]